MFCLLSHIASAFTICEREDIQMAGPPSYPGAPRWLKACAIAVGGVALLLVILIHGGSSLRHHIPTVGGLSHNAAHEGGR